MLATTRTKMIRLRTEGELRAPISKLERRCQSLRMQLAALGVTSDAPRAPAFITEGAAQ